MAELIPWVIVAALVVVVLIFYLRSRSAESQLVTVRAAKEKTETDLEDARGRLSKSQDKSRQASEDIQQLRKKLEKVKKRLGSTTSLPSASASRVQQLEEALELSRQERDRLREEVSGLRAELTRLREVARSNVEEAENPQLKSALEAQSAASARIADLESILQKAQARAADAERSVDRLRGKARTQDLLYVSLRSELDAKKDRLRTQQEEIERLRALKVALVDDPPENASEPISDDSSST